MCYETTIEARAWINNQIPMIYVDMIIYPCLDLDADLANLW